MSATFRFHRGSLEESQKTAVEVKDLDELVEVIEKEGFYTDNKQDLRIHFYGYDERTKESLHIVEAKGFDGPIGFLIYD